LPAGEERAGPWPAVADGEGALPGVAGEFGGEVPDPERVRVGVAEFGVAAVAEEAGPGGEVGGDVRREDPSPFRWAHEWRRLNQLFATVHPSGAGRTATRRQPVRSVCGGRQYL
jgi:hypothetical protein